MKGTLAIQKGIEIISKMSSRTKLSFPLVLGDLPVTPVLCFGPAGNPVCAIWTPD
jgi:hypothetical protein